MTMKWLVSIAFSIFIFDIASGQYLKNLPHADQLDTQLEQATSLSADARFDQSISSYRGIAKTFDSLYLKENQKAYLQNAVHADLYALYEEYKNNSKARLLDSLPKIEQKIKSVFKEDHLLYSFLHFCQVRFDSSKSAENKALLLAAISNYEIQEPQSFILNACYDLLVNFHFREGSFDDALKIIEQVHAKREAIDPFNPTEILYSMSNKVRYYYYTSQLDQLEKVIFKEKEIGEKYLRPDHPRLEVIYSHVSVFAGVKSDYEMETEYKNKAMQLRSKRLGDPFHPLLLTNHINIAGAYAGLGMYDVANAHLDTAIIIQGALPEDPEALSAIHLSKGNVTPDRIEAMKHYKEILKYEDVLQGPGQGNIASAYNNLGVACKETGDYPEAAKNFLKAIQFRQKIGAPEYELISSYYNIASLYDIHKDETSALKYLFKNLEILENTKKIDVMKSSSSLRFIGKIYRKQGKLNESEKYLNLALAELKGPELESSWSYVETLMALANLKIDQKLYADALNHTAQAKEILRENSDENKVASTLLSEAYIHLLLDQHDKWYKYQNEAFESVGLKPKPSVEEFLRLPEIKRWNALTIYLNALKLRQKYNKSSPNKSIPIETSEISSALEFIDMFKSNYFFEHSEKQFRENVSLVYELGVEHFCAQYRANPNAENAELLYQIIEKSKSIVLNRNYKLEKAISRLPDKIKNEEKNLMFAYEMAYQAYKALDVNSNIDSARIEKVSNDFESIQKKKTDFIAKLKKEYPDYLQARYNQQIPSLGEIRQYSRTLDLAVLNFFETESDVVLFFVHGQNDHLITVPKDELKPTILELRSLLVQPDLYASETMFQGNMEKFAEVARSLYEKLELDSVLKNESCTSLLIIPDGIVCYLPFDALLKASPRENDTYKEFHYLIRDYKISYAVSSSHLMFEKDKRKEKLNYSGFAPSYAQANFSLERSADTTLHRLFKNKAEIQSTSEILNGTAFLDSLATKEQFYNSSKNYNCLHLAMHAVVNDSVPMNSYLGFYNSELDEEQRLHSKDISRTSLDTRLTILSACNINTGRIVNGEGILGLARSFQMANSPNVVLSNWVVDDKSASEIIYQYFSKIKAGASSPEALKDAKLKYIKESSLFKSHPAYWATFSYFGTPESVFITQKPYLNILCAAIFALLMFLCIFYRKM